MSDKLDLVFMESQSFHLVESTGNPGDALDVVDHGGFALREDVAGRYALGADVVLLYRCLEAVCVVGTDIFQAYAAGSPVPRRAVSAAILHPKRRCRKDGGVLKRKPEITGEMFWTLMYSWFAVTLLGVWLIMHRYRVLRLEELRDEEGLERAIEARRGEQKTVQS